MESAVKDYTCAVEYSVGGEGEAVGLCYCWDSFLNDIMLLCVGCPHKDLLRGKCLHSLRKVSLWRLFTSNCVSLRVQSWGVHTAPLVLVQNQFYCWSQGWLPLYSFWKYWSTSWTTAVLDEVVLRFRSEIFVLNVKNAWRAARWRSVRWGRLTAGKHLQLQIFIVILPVFYCSRRVVRPSLSLPVALAFCSFLFI